MNIVIQRTSKTPSYIAGKLYIDRCYFCDTVEHTASALPAGEYRIIRHHCHQYARHMPLIVPIEPGSNVRLYPSAPQHRRQEQEAGWRINATRCQHCPSVEVIGLNTLMPCCCPMLKPGKARASAGLLLQRIILCTERGEDHDEGEQAAIFHGLI